MSDPASTQRRRTWGRVLIIMTLLVVLGGIAAWIAIPRLLDINTYRATIEAEASRRLGRPIRIGRMELTAFPQPTAVIHDLAVVGQGMEGESVLSVPILRARARLMPLLASRQLELTELTLEEPEIALVRAAAGRWNWQEMLEPKTQGSTGRANAGGSHWQPERVTITRGTIRVTDEQAEIGRVVTWTLQPFDLEVRTSGAGRPIDMDLDMMLAAGAGRGALSYKGRIGPLPVPFDAAKLPLDGDLKAEHFPLRALLPYVRQEDGIRALDGLVTSDLHLALGPSSELAAKGYLDLEHVRYELGGSSPRSGMLDFAAKVDLSAMNGRQDLDLRQLELTLPDGRLAVSGEVRNADAPRGGHLKLKVDGRQVNLRALEPVATLAGFELPIAALGSRPFDVAGAIERQTVGGAQHLVLRDVHLKGIDGALHRGAAGSWSAGGALPAGNAGSPAQVEVENLWIENSTLTIQDQSSGPSSAMRLTEVDLKVDHYGSGKPGRGSLAAVLPGGGKLSFEGTLGPAANGQLPIKGTGVLRGVAMDLAAPRGGSERQVLDGEVAFDAVAEQGGQRLIFRSCRIKLPSGTFAFTGTLDRQGGANLADISVAPTRMKIEDLQSLAAWVGVALPGKMQSPDPIEIALRARGNLANRSQLRLDGSLKATRLTWAPPFLHEPLTDVAATMQFTGDGVEAKGFTATLGETTWRGDLAVHDLGAPRVNFALAADQADLGQLMSALTRGPGSGQASAQGSAGAQSDLLSKAAGGGTIAIKSGTFNTLAFSDLRATVTLDGRTIRFAPLGFGLYGGKYAGESAVDLRGVAPVIQHDCVLVGVDANGLLSANTNMKDVLHGTLSARFDGSGSGQTMEALLKSLVGSGDFKIVNGTLTRSSMLKGLSDVAGLFGERTLTQLSQRMTTNETPFSALTAAFRIAGGQLTTDNLQLQSNDFGLAAKGQVALDRRLGFQGRIVFSDLISRTLREEGSRAVYQGEENGRVAIPVAVSGTIDRPSFAVDFGAAAGYAVAKTITDRLAESFNRRQASPKSPPVTQPPPKSPAATQPPPKSPAATQPPLATKVPPKVTLPVKVPPATTPPPATKSPAPSTPPAASRPDTTSTASKDQAPLPVPPAPKTPEPPKAATAGDLRVRVDSHQFRGDRSQPDLAVKGAVSGSHLASLLVIVTDGGGRLIHQEKRLEKEIVAAYGNRPRSETVTVPFDFHIAGTRLPASAKSIKMTLVAVADNGKTSPAASIAEKNPRGV